jgi:Hydroxymethylglutaryl-coenzyme A synthase N terminal
MFNRLEFSYSCMPSRFASVIPTFLSQCVDQAELEKFDGVSQGKYTIGLGQTKMSFCDDREGEQTYSSYPPRFDVDVVKISTPLPSPHAPTS